ncbi:NAD(P)-dependent oxidoreductase [Oryzomonas japonica]|uniref:NAD(P)-dependent oxidoreductase n=1 Tax=Oryzomonas japonica TaxID=2603858 RepID=A0A7J4ZRL8_9BACT|nr:NAD(P)-dependent oxidoreductase [Oryzomonas japonica]KAB0665818.1 NAD(P)-dependent oxidoreductase [Oryzomonas japonica]
MLRKIGFIGLGTVGRHMAANLSKGSYELTVFDTDPSAVSRLVELGAEAATSAAEAARDRDLVIAIVPEGEELGRLFFGEDGILAGIGGGTILADMGSHSLDTTMKMADECAKKRVLYLDAPVWGSKEHAANGLLTIVTGGDPSLVGRCREPFSCFGLNIIHVGEVGDATKMKFIVNMVQAELVQVLAEGLVLGDKMGFTADKILEVLDTRGVASPLFHLKGRAMARGDFTRSLALKYVHEQLHMVLNAARLMGLNLPTAEAASKVYEKAVDAGWGEEDFSAVIKALR